MTFERKRYLRNPITGRIFEWDELLARNPDLEEYHPTKDPKVVKPKTTPAVRRGAIKAQAAKKDDRKTVTPEELRAYIDRVKQLDDVRTLISLSNRFAKEIITPDPEKNGLTLEEARMVAVDNIERFYEGRISDVAAA